MSNKNNGHDFGRYINIFCLWRHKYLCWKKAVSIYIFFFQKINGVVFIACYIMLVSKMLISVMPLPIIIKNITRPRPAA